MSFISNMIRRGSMYYFRRRVPPDLQAIFGLKVIRESLHERDAKKARRLHADRNLYWEQRFETERSKPGKLAVDNDVDDADIRLALLAHLIRFSGATVEMTPALAEQVKNAAPKERLVADLSEEVIQQVVEKFERDLLQADESWRIGGYAMTGDGISDFEFDIHGQVIAGVREETAKNLARGRHLSAQNKSLVDLMLLPFGLRLDPESPTYRQLAIERLNRQAKVFEAMAARHGGQAVPTPKAPAAIAKSPSQKPRVTASELLMGWQLECEPKQKTFENFSSKLRDFEKYLGGRDLAQATPEDATGWKEARKKAGIANKTLTKDLDSVKAVLNWATTNHKILQNPFRDVRVGGKNAKKSDIRPYTPDETLRILLHVRNETGFLKWIVWLAAFTGARIAELAQLHVGDVGHQDGIDFLDINAKSSDKSVKTPTSKRKIPLHAQLIEEGFLKFVKSRAAYPGPLFPEIKPDRYGTRGGAASNRMRYLVRKQIGITDPLIAPMHSFRHAFKDTCRNSLVSTEVHDVLTGHAELGVAAKYGEGMFFRILAGEVAKLLRIEFPTPPGTSDNRRGDPEPRRAPPAGALT